MGKNLADMTSDNSTSFDRHPINTFRGVSRLTSGVSFAGSESFEEVCRGFEFSGDRSFYPPPARNSRAPHRREDSAFSIASVSSYGRVLNDGVSDLFDYGLPRLQEHLSCEDISSISMSLTVDDTFAFIRASHVHVSIVMHQVSTFTLLPVVMDRESPTCRSHLKYPQLAFITATSDITGTTLRLHPVQFLIPMHDMDRTAGFLPGHITGKIPL